MWKSFRRGSGRMPLAPGSRMRHTLTKWIAQPTELGAKIRPSLRGYASGEHLPQKDCTGSREYGECPEGALPAKELAGGGTDRYTDDCCEGDTANHDAHRFRAGFSPCRVCCDNGADGPERLPAYIIDGVFSRRYIQRHMGGGHEGASFQELRS